MGRFRKALRRAMGRDRTSAAPPGAPVRSAAPQPSVEPVGVPDASGHRLATADELLERLSEGVVVVHHWATWCAPCLAELPAIDDLAAALPDGVELLGVSWEAFMGHDTPRSALAATQRFAAGRGGRWASWVVQDAPEAFFDALDLPVQTVPQTAVYREGQRVAVWPGPLEQGDAAKVLEAAGA